MSGIVRLGAQHSGTRSLHTASKAAFNSQRPSLSSARRLHHLRHHQALQPLRSFEGEAAKSLQEAAALDDLIDVLMTAKTQQQLAKEVGLKCVE